MHGTEWVYYLRTIRKNMNVVCTCTVGLMVMIVTFVKGEGLKKLTWL